MTSFKSNISGRLLVAFALSGISALIYEVIWARLLGDLFGHTVYAIQVVLAVFFGGIAAGSFLSDRFKLNKKNSVRAYAVIEIIVGVFGILLPQLARLLTPIYDRYAPVALETGSAMGYRLAIAIALLIVPTALMGATFPLVARWQFANDGKRSAVATLYAVNTVGSALGAWLSAFVFMRLLGVGNTLFVAALGNFLAASLALSIKSTQPAGCEEEISAEGDTSAQATPSHKAESLAVKPLTIKRLKILEKFFPLLLFLTGFVAISLEVLWSRALDQILSGSIYSFATVLFVFLLGIAAGSWAYRKYLQTVSSLLLFVILEIVLTWYVIASLFMIRSIPALRESLLEALGPGFVQRGIAVESLLSAFILLIPTLCMGILFPLLLNMGLQSSRRLGALVGANTAGSVAAPLIVGFFFLPRLGLLSSLLLVAALCLITALLVAAFAPLRAKPLLLASAGIVALILLAFTPRDIRHWGKQGERLIDYREDPAATISVVEYGERAREKKLKVNNTYSLGGGRGIFTERRQGHLPMLLHPSPARVLALGVGTGNTLGAVSLHHPDYLLGVELIPGVLELAKKNFGDSNYNVLDNPQVRVVNADALRVVRSASAKYDVIIADLFHPWQAGVGALYSREHFLATRNALAPEGVFCQWLPLYQLSEENLKTIIRTFLSVYPEANAWLGNFGSQTPVLALAGSQQPIFLHWKRWEDSLADPALRDSLAKVYMDRPTEVIGGYIGAREELEKFAGDGSINSLDRPVIEFSAPEMLFAEAFEASKRNSLEALIHLSWQPQIPVSFAGASAIVSEQDARADVEAARWMIQSFLEAEKGDRQGALNAAMQSCQASRGYDIPSAVLAEIAWTLYQQSPSSAEQAFKQALRVRPDDANALTGLGATYLFQRRADEAIAAFEKALKSRPDWSEALEGIEKAKRLKSAASQK